MSRTLALTTGASSGVGAARARHRDPDHELVPAARRPDRPADLADEPGAVSAMVGIRSWLRISGRLKASPQ
ncbi:hypothetical protein [Streptomyces sp. NPDC057002]|uniref:hypothetical protein n=1 Tax=Streptomyces sp. NPDC057002 TaxID=3345992 RepID=UPI003634827C